MYGATEGRSHDRAAGAGRGLRVGTARTPRRGTTVLAVTTLVALFAGVAAFIVAETGTTAFGSAEWTWLLERTGRGGAVILDPSDGSLAVVPLALTHLLWSTVGIDDHAPYRDLLLAAHLVLVTTVYVYAGRRRGWVAALLPAVVVLGLGAGWQNVLLPFQLGWVLSIATGAGALLLLDRRRGLTDAGACVLLGVALASSATGLAVAVGIAVELVLRRGAARALWVVAPPVLAYAGWWLRYQDGLPGTDDLLAVPWHVVVLAASTLSGAAGLTGSLPVPKASLGYGLPLLAALLALLAWRRPGPADAPRAWGLVAALLAFWVGVAATHGAVAPADLGRYLTFGAVFGLLLAIELAPRVAASDGVALGLAAVVLGIGLSGLQTLRGAAEPQRDAGILTSSELTALDLAAPGASPTATVRVGDAPGVAITVADYRRLTAAYGTPAGSAGSVSDVKDAAPRTAADGVLLGLAGPALLPATPGENGDRAPAVLLASGLEGPRTSGCRNYRASTLNLPGGASRLTFTVPREGAFVGASGSEPVTVGVRRFGSDPVPLGTVAPERAATVRMPPAAGGPWTAVVGFTAGVSICGAPR